MDFKKIFDNTGDEEKISFLYKLLENNSDLRKQFIDTINTSPINDATQTVEFNEFIENIVSFYEDYKSDMESLNLEDTDWENYTPRHSGYIEEWEAAQYMAEDEADMMFSFFEERIVTMLLENKLEDLFSELISFYFAAKDADINDPYCNLGDPANDYFIDKHKEFINYSIDKIMVSNIKDKKIIYTIGLFFKYFETRKPDCYADIKIFEPLLTLLVNKIENNKIIPNYERITSVSKSLCPVFSLSIEEKTGNDKAWLKQAHKNLWLDTQIGEKLLKHYFTENIDEYISVATKLFNHDKPFWADKIGKDIKIEHNKDLFKKIRIQKCINENTIDNYLLIKDILTEEEKKQLHNELKHEEVYQVQIYQIEKQYDKIKEIVQCNVDSWEFDELIEPILNKYPEFCFRLIEKKTLSKIEKDRGRGVYSRIASWLKLSKQINGYQNQSRELINRLYNHKPNLPALKDEFRMAGLV